MGDFTVNVRQKPMDLNRWQLELVFNGVNIGSPTVEVKENNPLAPAK
jgi:hypothetical protein